MTISRRFSRNLFIILVVFGWVFWRPVFFEEKLIYFPSHEFELTPDSLAMRYEELMLTTADGKLVNGWFLPTSVDSVSDRFTILVSHGNAGNISHRLDRVLLMHSNLNADVLLFDYRGFGRSIGKPSELGTYEDARAAYKYLIDERKLSPDRIILFGESLGAAVALQLAIEVKAAGLVLEAPFTSIANMARELYPLFAVRWIRNRYDNLTKIKRLSVPLLIVHGTADRIVPFTHGQELFRSAPEPKNFLVVEGAGHSDMFLKGRDVYWTAWKDFLSNL